MDKRVVSGGMNDDEIAVALLDAARDGLMRAAGYVVQQGERPRIQYGLPGIADDWIVSECQNEIVEHWRNQVLEAWIDDVEYFVPPISHFKNYVIRRIAKRMKVELPSIREILLEHTEFDYGDDFDYWLIVDGPVLLSEFDKKPDEYE